MRLLFAGTPHVALPSLEALAASDHELVAVLTRPDAPAGRGRSVSSAPVAVRARELGLEVLTPARPGDPDFLARLRDLAVDAAPIVAYGGLIPPDALDLPRHGWVNLHFSLLPAWRGAAPVQRAIMAGDDVTGATTFRLERGLDTGPTYGTMTEPVRADDTAGALLDRLAAAGARLLLATVDQLAAGRIQARPQPLAGVSLAPKVTVDEARVAWDASAYRVDRLVRGCTPSPGAWTEFRGERLKLLPVSLVPAGGGSAAAVGPGELVVGRREVLVGTGSEPVRLGLVQPAGRKPMPAPDWARGVRAASGDRLGAP